MAQHEHAELSRKEVGRQRKPPEARPCRRYPPNTRSVIAKMRLLMRSRAVQSSVVMNSPLGEGYPETIQAIVAPCRLAGESGD